MDDSVKKNAGRSLHSQIHGTLYLTKQSDGEKRNRSFRRSTMDVVVFHESGWSVDERRFRSSNRDMMLSIVLFLANIAVITK